MTRAAPRAAAVFTLVAAAFLPALRFPFLNWDDKVNVVENGLLRFDAPGLVFRLTGSKLGHWQPATWLTLALDRALWGGDPFGFYLTNALLHAGGAALMFLLARRFRRADLGASPSARRVGAVGHRAS